MHPTGEGGIVAPLWCKPALMRPHFLFEASKSKRPRPVKRKNAWPSSGSVETTCGKYGGPRKRPLRRLWPKRWARAKVSHSNRRLATRIGIAVPVPMTDLLCFYLCCRCPGANPGVGFPKVEGPAGPSPLVVRGSGGGVETPPGFSSGGWGGKRRSAASGRKSKPLSRKCRDWRPKRGRESHWHDGGQGFSFQKRMAPQSLSAIANGA